MRTYSVSYRIFDSDGVPFMESAHKRISSLLENDFQYSIRIVKEVVVHNSVVRLLLSLYLSQ
jgi:hypothetical protein